MYCAVIGPLHISLALYMCGKARLNNHTLHQQAMAAQTSTGIEVGPSLAPHTSRSASYLTFPVVGVFLHSPRPPVLTCGCI